jgi:hypothetical protein
MFSAVTETEALSGDEPLRFPDGGERLLPGRVGIRGAELLQALLRAVARRQGDGDHDIGAHGPAGRDGDGICNAAVDEGAALDHLGDEDAGQGVGGAHRADEIATVEPDFVSAQEGRCDGGVAGGELFDVVLTQRLGQRLRDAVAHHEAAALAEVEVRQFPHGLAVEREGEVFEIIQAARGPSATDDGADGRASHD